MENFHFVHLSNRTEKLYQELKERLFATSHPLTKRLIIVPSAAMKSWLMLQMAEDPSMAIAAGIEIGFVEPTIHSLYQLLSKNKINPIESCEVSQLELALALEKTILAVAMTDRSIHAIQADWIPLLQYLDVRNEDGGVLSRRTLKRVRALSLALAKVFCDYGVYGQNMLQQWKQKKISGSWQELLWLEMESIFSSWDYPVRKLRGFEVNEECDPQDIQVHLFGLSFLAPLHHRFFQKISAQLPVYYYVLSPCQKFWGDTLSDKEGMYLKDYWNKQGVNRSNLESLEGFLSDRNPLLANFGRLGREMTVQTESMDALSVEAYALPKSVLQIPFYNELVSDDVLLEDSDLSLTLLEAIQADVALLRSSDKQDKLIFHDDDKTIQVHAAPKKIREVQVIYDVLMGIIDKHRHDKHPIVPADIFVMAPNISEYAPFIRSVFESSESQLDIQLADLQVPSQHILIQGFMHLLSLSKGRWEASALLQLFEYSAFRKRHRLNKEDVFVICKWVKEAGIYWGKDHHHREEIFKRDYHTNESNPESLIGTWEYGLGRLLEGLAMLAENPVSVQEQVFSPLDRIEVSQAELLGKILHLVRSLQIDFKPLMDGSLLTLEEWSIYLTCLFDAYFVKDADDADIEGYRILKSCFDAFAKASRRLKDTKFHFETIYGHLKELLKGETATYKESSLQAVRFSSLLPMRAVPAKVIVLMGMGEGLFPRLDQTNTLNLLLGQSQGDYYPERVDFDRYIFLESILSARRYFILSYVSQESGEVKAQPPSLLVKELLSYMDSSYQIIDKGVMEKPSKSCVYHHPLVPFHQSYFSKDSRFKSYSYHNYLASIAHYRSEKRLRHAFLSDFMPKGYAADNLHEMTIDLKDLLAYSKSPIKVYLNQVLGIYLDRESDRAIQDEEDLFLSDLNASLLSKQGLFGSKMATLAQAEKVGKLPPGPFKVVGAERIEREIDQLSDHLKSSGIAIEELFSIEFMERYHEAKFSDGVWKVPPLILELPDKKRVKITGRLDNVSEKGLVILNQDEVKKVLELWPSCLVLLCLIEKYSLKVLPQLIFIKKKLKIRKITRTEKQVLAMQSLSEYLQYYLASKNGVSALVPDWVPSILSGSSEEFNDVFKEEMNEEFQPKYDQYLTWLERNSPNAALGVSLDHWKKTAESLFVDIFEGKSKKAAVSLMEDSHDIV